MESQIISVVFNARCKFFISFPFIISTRFHPKILTSFSLSPIPSNKSLQRIYSCFYIVHMHDIDLQHFSKRLLFLFPLAILFSRHFIPLLYLKTIPTSFVSTRFSFPSGTHLYLFRTPKSLFFRYDDVLYASSSKTAILPSLIFHVFLSFDCQTNYDVKNI